MYKDDYYDDDWLEEDNQGYDDYSDDYLLEDYPYYDNLYGPHNLDSGKESEKGEKC